MYIVTIVPAQTKFSPSLLKSFRNLFINYVTQISVISCLHSVLTIPHFDNTELKQYSKYIKRARKNGFIASTVSHFYWCNSANFLITNAASVGPNFLWRFGST